MDCDEFPFNLSDFVTVDEVGEVADLPCHPPSPETMEDAATSIQADASEVYFSFFVVHQIWCL